MRDAAASRGGVGVLSGPGLCGLDIFGRGLDVQRRIHHQHPRRRLKQAKRNEILGAVIGQLRIHELRDDVRYRNECDRVAICGRLKSLRDAYVARATRLVVDEDGLTKYLPHLLAYASRQGVACPARRIRHDDVDRLRWPGLRNRRCCGAEREGSTENGACQDLRDVVHGVVFRVEAGESLWPALHAIGASKLATS